MRIPAIDRLERALQRRLQRLPRTADLPVRAGDHPQFGRAGPTHEGELLKKSDHVGEWRDRWFVLRERRLWYYENRGDSKPMKGKPEGLPKGWFDTTAAKVARIKALAAVRPGASVPLMFCMHRLTQRYF